MTSYSVTTPFVSLPVRKLSHLPFASSFQCSECSVRLSSYGDSAGGSLGSGPSLKIVLKQGLQQPVEVALPASRALTSQHQDVITTNPSPQQLLLSGGWTNFVEAVSGEWDGYGADFTSDGKPLELPAQVVPDAYRDWGVQVHDWQTQCPTLGDEEKASLFYKVIRLYPTVGCEADAATAYSMEERKIEAGSDSGVLAFHESGCYSAVLHKREVRHDGNSSCCEVEHCLLEPGNVNKSRMRILQEFTCQKSFGNTTVCPSLRKITIYREVWDGPFRNGESPGGCSISGSGFATTTPLEPYFLLGSWRIQKSSCNFKDLPGQPHKNGFTASIGELLPATFEMKNKEFSGKEVLLPTGVWSTMTVNKPGYLHAEAGWLVNSNTAIVSTCEISVFGELEKAELSIQHRQA